MRLKDFLPHNKSPPPAPQPPFYPSISHVNIEGLLSKPAKFSFIFELKQMRKSSYFSKWQIWRNLTFIHICYVCDWKISTNNTKFMLFCCNLCFLQFFCHYVVLSQDLFCCTLCAIAWKNLERKIRNIRHLFSPYAIGN